MEILIIILNSNKNNDLKLGKESREIQNGLSASPYRNRYSVSVINSARTIDIRRRILKDKPEYIHICGHGVKNEGIIIQDDDGNEQILDGETLKEFFGIFSETTKCILINSCYSDRIAKNISEKISYVIGMKNKIQDEDAIEFAVAFYDGIFSGEDVENSFVLASNSLKWNSNVQYPNPVLYKRDYNLNGDEIYSKKRILIAPSRLPVGNCNFCGREKELNFLKQSWEDKKVNIVCVEAWGGVGKTALVEKWRSEMINGGIDTEVIFDWSFHSQGNINNRPMSADLFFDEAFKWFKSENVDGAMEKGEKLALCVRKRKTLVILDGVEALQYSDNFVGKEGEIKDHSLRVFISMLSDYNPGLCVITTRKQIANLNFSDSESNKLLKLSYLDIEQSKQLLCSYDIYGKASTIYDICQTFLGHALSLNLVATYIRDSLCRNADKFNKASLLGTGNSNEIKVIKIMRSYERWYGDGKQIRILRILSLFDRPAKQDEVKYLLSGSEIKGLSDGFLGLQTNEFGNIIRQLKHASLVMEYVMDNIDYLDTHPIIRDYFSRELIDKFYFAYREGHYRLYEYFSKCGKESNDTTVQMNFWFRAVYHGCLAERYTEVFECIYLPYMKQGEMIYDARVLGGNSTDLDAISGFFSETWTELKGDLDESKKAAIFAEASFALRSNGLIEDAIIPLEIAFEIEKKLFNYEEAAMHAGNLSELYLVIGSLDKAFGYVEEGIYLAEKSDRVWRHYWIQLAKKADILSKKGKSDFSIAFFRQAESVQKYFDKESERLYGVLAFKKFDSYLVNIENIVLVPYRLETSFLLKDKEKGIYLAQLKEYENQVHIALEHDYQYKRILHMALDNLILVRISMLKSILTVDYFDNNTEMQLSEIVNDLYRAGRAEYIPYGLLTRIRYQYFQKNVVKIEEDINKIQDIIQDRNFKLFETEIMVEKFYLYLLKHDSEEAFNFLYKAEYLCSNIGYLRKRAEINAIIEKIIGDN